MIYNVFIQNSNPKKSFHVQHTENILEDPESYNTYITRQKNKRKEEESKTERERNTPGSGYVWKNKNMNFNINYDYTKHENTKRDFPTSETIRSLNKVWLLF